MNILTKIIVFLRIDKLIDSIRKYQKDKRKRQDLEQIRSKKEIAHVARTLGHNEFAKYYEGEAKIIKDTKED